MGNVRANDDQTSETTDWFCKRHGVRTAPANAKQPLCPTCARPLERTTWRMSPGR